MQMKQNQLKKNIASSPPRASFAFIAKAWNDILDIVYPPVCAHCGQVDNLICEQCLDLIDTNHRNYYSPLIPYPHIVIGPHHGVLRSAIHALKYDNETRLGKLLGTWLAAEIDAQGKRINTVIPVPLHTARLKERGYNQAELIAQQIADESGALLNNHVLQRQRYTTSQVNLSAEERRHNVDGAFIISAKQAAQLKGEQILLVDDVCTTGATLWSCIEALRAIEASEITIATVSYAIH